MNPLFVVLDNPLAQNLRNPLNCKVNVIGILDFTAQLHYAWRQDFTSNRF
jgi:hypothetical protein